MPSSATRRAPLVDLSHVVEDGLVTYPGLPAAEVRDFLTHEASRGRYAPDTTFHIGRIAMVANTGTYLDTPFHRFPDGGDLAALPLEAVADLPGVRVDATGAGRSVGPDSLPDGDLRGHAVLFHTGWSRRWGGPSYFEGHPFLEAGTAEALVRRGAALVGIDSLNIDDTADAARPVHTTLLRAGVPVVEHLAGLEALPPRGFRFFAVPVKVRGMGTFPVRAFARLAPEEASGEAAAARRPEGGGSA
jgi:kynurenine formamidase